MEIKVASHLHDCAAALDNIDSIAADLVDAKATPGHALCLCTAPARKLVIRTVGKRHFLAVWPHDGHNHHYACLFHRDEVSTSQDSAGAEPAIKETRDGFDIATDFPLQRVNAPDDPTQERNHNPVSTQIPRPTRARMGLLGILHHLWAEARLNQWGALWKRDWWRVTQALLPVIEQGSLGKRHMVDWLYLVPEFRVNRKDAIEAAWQDFRSRLGTAEHVGDVRFGLLLGEAKLFEKSAYGYKMLLRHFPPSLFLSLALREKLSTSYPRAFHRIGDDDGQRVMCLCLVDLTPKGNLNLIDAALMATSAQYIPVDSSYEAQLAHKLVDERRSFSKPLKISHGDSALPDFVLSDTNPPFVLEVFGMTSTAYLERKAEKLERYRAEGKPVWSWNADQESRPPRLPAPGTFRSTVA
jgi:hypothetical protein